MTAKPATRTPAESVMVRQVAAWRDIAGRLPDSTVKICSYSGRMEIMITSVHAGDSSDITGAYLTGRDLMTGAEVTVRQPAIAAGTYWLRPCL